MTTPTEQIPRTLRIAFVIDTSDSYDESGVQIVDVISIFPLGEHLYAIQTEPFNDHSITTAGAGRAFRTDQIISMINHLQQYTH